MEPDLEINNIIDRLESSFYKSVIKQLGKELY